MGARPVQDHPAAGHLPNTLHDAISALDRWEPASPTLSGHIAFEFMGTFVAAKVVALASDFFNHCRTCRDIQFADRVLNHHILRGQGGIGGLFASKITKGFPKHQK